MKNKIIGLVSKHKFFVTVFLGLFSIYGLWWLSFFPGTMSPDSLSHWYEATSFKFSNASPYLYTLILAGLIRIWETPAVMGLLQLSALALIVSLFINYAYKQGIDKRLLALVALFFALYPVYGIYNITIWKDVLYSYVVLAALVLCFILVTDRVIMAKKYWFYFLAFLCALIPLLRFNGVMFFIFIPTIVFVIIRPAWKKMLLFLAIQLGTYLFFAVILLNALHVTQAPLMKEGLYVKLAGAIYHLDNPKLRDSERVAIEKIMPKETWEKYYQCITVDRLFYEGLPETREIDYRNEIDPNPQVVKEWHQAVISASIRNPQAILYDKACMGSYLVGVKNILYKYEGSIFLGNSGGPIKYESKFPLGKRALYKYLNLLSSGTADGYGVEAGIFSKLINFIFWSALIPVTIFVFYGYLALKQRLWGLLGYVSLMFLNIAMVIAIVPAASFRYMYVVFVAVPFLPIIYLLDRKKTNTD